MNTKIFITGLLVLLAFSFFAGCTQEEIDEIEAGAKGNPAESFDFLALKSKNLAPVKLDYLLSIDLGAQGVPGMSQIETDLSLSVLTEKKSKVVASLNFLGQTVNTAVYNLDGLFVQCVEGNAFGSEIPLSCELSSEEGQVQGLQNTAVKTLDDQFEEYKISFTEQKELAGRPAACFLISFKGMDLKDKTQFQNSLEESTFNKTVFSQEICLDEEKGFTSFMKLEGKSFSDLTEKEEIVMAMELELKGFSETVTEEDLKIPVLLEITQFENAIACTAEEITMNLTYFNNVSGKEAVIGIGPVLYDEEFNLLPFEATQELTVHMPEQPLFESKEFKVSPDKPLDGTVAIALCIGEECFSTDCIVSGESAEAGKLPEVTDDEIAIVCSLVSDKASCEAFDLDGDGIAECAWVDESCGLNSQGTEE